MATTCTPVMYVSDSDIHIAQQCATSIYRDVTYSLHICNTIRIMCDKDFV